MMNVFSGICPVCGGTEFGQVKVLWEELITAWQLSDSEVEYVNRQQGFHCMHCNNNLRSMALAAAILREYELQGALNSYCEHHADLSVLEINRAGNLTPFLQKLPNHRLIEYPQFDMLALTLEPNSFDLIVHSDTLEHVADPLRALSECRRVLRESGRCIFTIPVIIDRMSRSRHGLRPSYHGQPGVPAQDQIVSTEFGVDAWKVVLNAGFASCEIYSFEYPAALVLIARKG